MEWRLSFLPEHKEKRFETAPTKKRTAHATDRTAAASQGVTYPPLLGTAVSMAVNKRKSVLGAAGGASASHITTPN
jgi:hypothetical protein